MKMLHRTRLLFPIRVHIQPRAWIGLVVGVFVHTRGDNGLCYTCDVAVLLRSWSAKKVWWQQIHCIVVTGFSVSPFMEGQVEYVGRAFVDHYYHLFDSDRSSLSSLYQPSSLLTFEGQRIQGADEITSKLNQLPFDQCRHSISTIDSQPCSSTRGIIVFVSGSLHLPEEEHSLRFSQMFHLIPTLEGSFFVQNDIFRLNYG